ncbi:MAG: FAD-dependent 5-carboxymethylaminomethyl-2-thiouridine(34) oxidoreductase MnmC [Rubrivivax sp.]|nr:FAD-dependent 5-carboxymethylaminomethyl-2-thiouridine(34) oxidoreductase MnmC [Rubrivivax sp.]
MAAGPPLSAAGAPLSTVGAGPAPRTVLAFGIAGARTALAAHVHPHAHQHLVLLLHQWCPAQALFDAPDEATQQAWPPPLDGWHPLALQGGRGQLTLVVGPLQASLKALDAAVDHFELTGLPMPADAALLKALGRCAAPGATVAALPGQPGLLDSWRAGLRSAGFVLAAGEPLRGAYAPPATVRRTSPRAGPRSRRAQASVAVIGAGLAGAWAAHALQQQGWSVTVFDRHPQPAQEASGNPAGLFHGTVNADDGAHARFHRAAALLAARTLRPWIAQGTVPGAIDGLLRLASAGESVGDLQALINRHALPADYVQALDAAQASARAGIVLDRPAWFYPGGGWVEPPALVRLLLRDTPFEGDCDVARIEPASGGWRLLNAHDHLIAETEQLVLANSADAARLWPQGGWPMGCSRGQISLWPEPPPDAPWPRLPVAGGGYVLRLPDGALLCGATAAPGDDEPMLRAADHQHNGQRLQQLTGWAGPLAPAGRVGWRANTVDRLPLVGPVAAVMANPPTAWRDLARVPGLYVLSGLGARGLTWGPLAGRLLAAWVSGAPMPVPAALRDAVDPGRWQLRSARRGSVNAEAQA